MNEFLMLLVILNPFAQVLYLFDLLRSLSVREFLFIHLKATLLSLIIFLVFALIGEKYLLKELFQIRFESLQIFGGLILTYLAFRYIVKGSGANLMFKGNISELALHITLPYMVGPGTIWISMLTGKIHDFHHTALIISAVLVINIIFLVTFQIIMKWLSNQGGAGLEKYFAILMRINALFIGAIGVEMILKAIVKFTTKV